MRLHSYIRLAAGSTLLLAPLMFVGTSAAQAPVASTVPFAASTPGAPHTSWSGNAVTLKGAFTSPNLGTDIFTWDWDPGDGGTHCTGTVNTSYTNSGPTNDPNVIACAHTYSGAVGTVFTAVLNVKDTTNGKVAAAVNCPPSITSGACYYTSLNNPPPNLPVEVNNAIDNGLWYLHTYMNRTTSTYGSPVGNWFGGAASGTNVDASSADTGVNSLDCTAFEVSGFLATNSPANPYSNDAQLCLNGVFDDLTTRNMAAVSPTGTNPFTNSPWGTYTPDSNSNGIGIEDIARNSGYTNYQTGMDMDSIAAAGTPTALVPAGTRIGTLASGKGTGPAKAYTYQDAVFDAVDDYSFCLNDAVSDGFGDYGPGGWHYTCQEIGGDNSVSQWAAIGIIPARRQFGTDPLNSEVLAMNENWLSLSFTQASTNNGYFGYTSGSPLWGPYAVTPSGLVQLAMDGMGRGTTVLGHNMWDSAETYIRDNFGNAQSEGAGSSLKDYYYGMFSFTKAMLLHDNSGTGLNNTPLTLLQSLDDPMTCSSPVPLAAPGSGTGPCYPPIDWYAAQSSTYGGTDPTDGVARTIVGNQEANGSWFNNNYTYEQNYFQTAVAIIMLNKTVFQPVPVACFTTNPSHVASGGPVTLNGACSVDQNPANHIVSWQWDVSGTGAGFSIGPGSPQCLDASCSEMISNFTLPPGKSLPYSYPVVLKVTDSANLTATVTGTVIISAPPNPPNANASGPYNFCPNKNSGGGLIYAPFLLDGSKSTNPDEGMTDGTPGAPPSMIVSYLWDYACAGNFTSASGEQVDATSSFNVPADYGTTFNVCLKVTNNDNLAFPSAGLSSGLSSVAAAQVSVHQPTDEVCTHCVQTLTGTPRGATPGVPANVALLWTDTNTSAQFAIDHYNVYRSSNASFVPFIQIAGASSVTGNRGVPVSNPPGGQLTYDDTYQISAGASYYYRIAPATANDTETCQSNVTLKVTVPGSGR